MTRGTVEGLEVPQALGHLLPAVYWEDPFTQELTAAFDAVLAPVYATLDCQDAYFDPWLTPPDFLEWLAGWVGVVLDETLPLDRRRRLVSETVRLYRTRGTAAGLREQIALFTGLEVEIEESGGVGWSETPGGPPPGDESFGLVVRLHAGGEDAVDLDVNRVAAIVRLSAPAHVPHRLEVVTP